MKRLFFIIAACFLLSVPSCIGARTSNRVAEKTDSITSARDTVHTELSNVHQVPDIANPLHKERKFFDLLTLLVAIVAICASVVELIVILRLKSRTEDRLDSHSDRIKALELYSLDKTQVSKLVDLSLQKFMPSIESKVEDQLNKSIAVMSYKQETEPASEFVSSQEPTRFPSEAFFGDFNPSYNGFPLDYLEKNPGKAFIIETVSETEANYRLVDDISPTMIQSALAGCVFEGDSQHYNRVVNTQDGTLSLDKDMNAWIVTNKVRILFK